MFVYLYLDLLKLLTRRYRAGLELLLGLLGSSGLKQQLDGAVALYKLANKAMTLSPVDAAPPSPTPQVCLLSSVGFYDSERVLNNE